MPPQTTEQWFSRLNTSVCTNSLVMSSVRKCLVLDRYSTECHTSVGQGGPHVLRKSGADRGTPQGLLPQTQVGSDSPRILSSGTVSISVFD